MKSPAASVDLRARTTEALVRAARESRLPHSIMLHGHDLVTLRQTAFEVAGLQLGVKDVVGHIDFRELRPSGRMRFIRLDDVLDAVRFANHSSHSGRKAIVVHEVDRMNDESANAFLKTLEEPMPGTGIILYTTSPYRILPTIISRCMRFNIGGHPMALSEPTWRMWLEDFQKLLESVSSPTRPPLAIVVAYGLLARFDTAHRTLVERTLEKDPIPEFADIEDRDEREDLQSAHTSRIERAVRTEMLAEMEDALRVFARAKDGRSRPVGEALLAIEDAYFRAHRLNVPPLLAIESAMLQLLRAMARSAQT